MNIKLKADIGKNNEYDLAMAMVMLNNYGDGSSSIIDGILSIKDVFRLRQVSTGLNSRCREMLEKIEKSLHKLDMAFYNAPLLNRLVMWSSEGQRIVGEAKRCIASLHGYKFNPKGVSGYEKDIDSKIESMNSSLIKTFFEK